MKFNNIYKGKTILVTGHTGFKGSWLCIWLEKLGANVIGYSNGMFRNDYIFKNSMLADKIKSYYGDIRNYRKLHEVAMETKPDFIFHLAAQALVRKSYDNPLETYTTNSIGTTTVLEIIKNCDFIKGGVFITSDKCYMNIEKDEGYREEDRVGGIDPYSSSKACAEIIIETYKKSILKEKFIASVRAGNVIGGGDFSEDRLIPDCIRAIQNNETLIVRFPNATRPWQHVLEPLSGYLLVGQKLLEGDKKVCQAWNFGPEIESVITVKDVISKITNNVIYNEQETNKHECIKLSLNIDKAKILLGWKPKWNVNTAIKKTVDWYNRAYRKENVYNLCLEQIGEYSKNE